MVASADQPRAHALSQCRAAFAGELGESINSLVAKYHDGNSEGGRKHRLVVALHPSLTTPQTITTQAIDAPETEK